MYVNGLSTSLPAEVQLQFLRAVPGLESVEMTRPGYAIEYDYFPPTQLHPTLESRALPGLYFAGQVNGTTGYEEAAQPGQVVGQAGAEHHEREPERERAGRAAHPPRHQLPDREAEAEHDRGRDQDAMEGDQRHDELASSAV
jgi:tRNA U34 5-carboxymethylaminomethyl modifying enzyme MnmG/GidA